MATYPEHLVQATQPSIKEWTISLADGLSKTDMETIYLLTGMRKNGHSRGDYTLASGG